jgi:glyoxylase-like metal-dependent hydrolase (beta-lactamase superfamily II)
MNLNKSTLLAEGHHAMVSPSGHYEVAGTTDWGSTFPRPEWFDIRQLEPHVWLIAEPGHVNSFLIEGTDSAVLLDTGLGVANIRSVVEGLSGKPILVVNSHHHFDHTGGNRLFSDIAIHRTGAELLQMPAPDDLASGYMDYTRRLLEAWVDYKHVDDEYLHLLTRETLLRPLPCDFNPEKYAIVPSTATRLLADGEELDLGGRRLRVLHTPGHSPDSICLLDEKSGLLFGGDTINTGPIYAHLDSSDIADFTRSTARLAELSASVSRVFVCHFMRVENQARFLNEVAEGFERILSGGATYRNNVDTSKSPVLEACFDHFSVFVPPDWTSPQN